MRRWAYLAGMLAVLGVGILVFEPVGAANKALTVKEIMKKLHKGPDAPLALVKRGLQADQPDWEEIQKTTRDFAVLGEALAKNDPPKGGKDSWEKLCKEYADSAKAMDEAARKKDSTGALAGQKILAGSCSTCHKAHRK